MATTLKDHGQFRRVDLHDVQLLWFCDFWDGPVNGVCLYNGEKCWFENWSEDDRDFPDSAPRRFLILRLSPQELADEEKWHELFRQKVGTHSDYGETQPQVWPKESHRDFYEAYEKRGKVDYSNNTVLGWFALS